MKAVIFDMDGVIIDSEPLHYQIDAKMLEDLGINESPEYLEKFVGWTQPDMWRCIIQEKKLEQDIEVLLSLQTTMKVEAMAQWSRGAIQGVPELLENLGHHLEEKEPEIDGKTVARCYFMMYYGEVAADIAQLRAKKGSKVTTSDVENITMMLGLLGKAYNAADFVLAKREWNSFARVMGQFHQSYDLYLTPTTAALPAKIGELQPKGAEAAVLKIVNTLGLGSLLKASGIADKLALESLSRTPFTQFVNFTGQPAMSVPLYWSKEGLPCGSHFVASFGNESLLYQLAGQLERAKPWFDRCPNQTPACQEGLRLSTQTRIRPITLKMAIKATSHKMVAPRPIACTSKKK